MRVQHTGARIVILIVAALLIPLWKGASVGFQTQNTNARRTVGVIKTPLNQNTGRTTTKPRGNVNQTPSVSNPTITNATTQDPSKTTDPPKTTTDPPKETTQDPPKTTTDPPKSDTPVTSNRSRVSLSLSANPASVRIGTPVFFTATSVPTNPIFRYRFIFGDGQETDWQESSNASHTYTAANDYYPKVEIASRGRESFVLGSAVFDHIKVESAAEVTIGPTKPNWLWFLIAVVVGAILIGGAYKMLKSLFTPEPTFVAYPNVESAAIKDAGAATLIEFELNLNPNLAEGFHDIITNAQSLISAERGNP